MFERKFKVPGGELQICINQQDNMYTISVDGVEWLQTENKVHASVLFNMMAEHLTEYMHYKKL